MEILYSNYVGDCPGMVSTEKLREAAVHCSKLEVGKLTRRASAKSTS